MDDDIKKDVREIRADVKELVKQGAIHNALLKEHEKRSVALEHRMDPLEKDYIFRNRLFTIMSGGGFLLVLIEIYRLLVGR